MPTSLNRGPKKKPRGKPFTKNDPRINMDGKPRFGEITKALRHFLTLSDKERQEYKPNTAAERIAFGQIQEALKKNKSSVDYVTNRAEGMPTTTLRANIDLTDSSLVIDILKPE